MPCWCEALQLHCWHDTLLACEALLRPDAVHAAAEGWQITWACRISAVPSSGGVLQWRRWREEGGPSTCWCHSLRKGVQRARQPACSCHLKHRSQPAGLLACLCHLSSKRLQLSGQAAPLPFPAKLGRPVIFGCTHLAAELWPALCITVEGQALDVVASCVAFLSSIWHSTSPDAGSI